MKIKRYLYLSWLVSLLLSDKIQLLIKGLKRLNLTSEKIGEKKKKGKGSENKDMVFVQGGKYTLSFFNEEREVSNLEVLKYPVTQGMWEELMGNSASNFVSGRNPIVKISWWETLKYCNKLSEKYGLEPVYDLRDDELKINQLGKKSVYPDRADFRKTEGYRLPTELEWEWFARGGEIAIRNGTFDSQYAGSNNLDEVAWWIKNSKGKTHVVGTKKPNELGLYDCSGNVSEWCYDTANGNYISKKKNYRSDSSKGTRILRGGSCYGDEDDCRVYGRGYTEATVQDDFFGFRVVRNV